MQCVLAYFRGVEVGLLKRCSFPLALHYLRDYALRNPAVCDSYDFTIKVLAHTEPDERIIYDISRLKPEVAAFSCYIWNLTRTLTLTRKLKCALPGIRIVLGGPEVSDAESILDKNPAVDIVVRGEGEETFSELLECLPNSKVDLASIPGIAFRQGDRIVVTAERPPIDDLDSIPSFVDDPDIEFRGIILYETSRGCPFSCKYCYWGAKRRSMRYFSMERVRRDLKALLSKKDIDTIFLIDSVLDVKPQRAETIIRTIAENNRYNTQINGFMEFHRFSDSLLELCKSINFNMGIGIQSTNKRALEYAGRKWFNIDRLESKIFPAIERHFPKDDIQLQMIMGLPGDDYTGFRTSIEWCFRHGYRRLAVERLYVLPGSDFYNNAQEYGLVFDSEPYHLAYSNSTFSYEDIIRSEKLFAGYRVLSQILKPEDLPVLEAASIDFFDMAEYVGRYIFRSNDYFLRRQEIEFTEQVDFNRVMELIRSFLAASGLNRRSLDVLGEVVRYRYLESAAVSFHRERYAEYRMADTTVDTSSTQYPQVGKFEYSKFEYGIENLLNGSVHSAEDVSREEHYVFFLLNHRTLRINTIKTAGGEFLSAMLRLLDGTRSIAEVKTELQHRFSDAEADAVDRTLESLLKKGLLISWSLPVGDEAR